MTEELFRADGYLRECEACVTAVQGDHIYLDRTVFFPEGGGQLGDTGVILRTGGVSVRIIDTLSTEENSLVHVVEDGADLPQVGENVTARIDWERRYRLMRMHSALHMLCSVVPAPVTGGSIRDGQGRLDFDLPEPVDKVELTGLLNQVIARDRPMSMQWITDQQLAEQPELVRTMSVKPPTGTGTVRLVHFEGVDLQPCGGTHVSSTGEIGSIRVRKIEKKGRQNRRVILVFDDSAS